MKKLISIVTPCFNEEENITDCHDAVRSLFDGPLAAYDYEHIFCDNASTDHTVDILRDLADGNLSVKIIINSRNFGPLRSNYNGVMSARGDAVLLFLPADSQDPPELIPQFVGLWEEGNEVVYGIRAEREEFFVMKIVRKLYYRIISRFSYVDFPPDVGDFQLVDRKVVDAMARHEDLDPFMRMMTFECGFKSLGVPYTWKARKKGSSKNRIYHLVDQGLNGLVTFSRVPLRLVLFGGATLAIMSIVYAFASLTLNLLSDDVSIQPGIPTLIVALFFFAGVQLSFIGILGEYIFSIYSQVRKRPMVIERERINFIDDKKS